jgi:4-amino-4-deoxy-L-arabinose transferase-like glycosyltransferase
LIGTLPWALLLVPLVRDLLRRKNGVAGSQAAAIGFVLLSAAWAFFFFSLAGSKRPIYLVPVFPPLALALGCYLDARLANAGLADIWASLARCRSRVAYGATAVALAGGVGVAAVTLGGGMREPSRAVVLIMAAGLALAVLLTKLQSRRTNWVVAGSIAFAMLLGCFHDLLPEYAQHFSLRHPVQIHAWQACDATSQIACYPHRWDTLAFYANRTELAEYSRDHRADLMRSFSHRRPTLLFVQTKFLSEVLNDLPPEFEFIARSRGDNVTIGEVRARREAPILLASKQ